MPRGGSRAGAGRPRGSKVKKTAELALQAGAEGLSPVELLLGIVRDENQPLTFRAHCAGIVLPFVTPRLAAVTIERKSNSDLIQQLIDKAKADGKLLPPLIEQKAVEVIPVLPAQPADA